MSDSELKAAVAEATKSAMKARDKARVGVLRLVTSEIKRAEIDGGASLDEDATIAVLTRMLKQRRDSLTQYTEAGRTDLADQEAFEIGVITEFMPAQLSDAEIEGMVRAAVEETGAASMADMGKVMGVLKPKLAGKADMGKVSALVKANIAS
ncbi:MAG: GatB/YqeY domain-containing protein [Pseudomonadaceae bacterium]|nr:GatB/YqeY domain-containing protein [Pseudomonadaceae bacterium]